MTEHGYSSNSLAEAVNRAIERLTGALEDSAAHRSGRGKRAGSRGQSQPPATHLRTPPRSGGRSSSRSWQRTEWYDPLGGGSALTAHML